MADKKISALTALAQGDVVVSTDVLPIVDTSATETKKIAVNALVGAAAAAGLTNVDINSGTIDGTTIATSDITVGSGKTLNVSAGTLTLADNQISGDKVEGGTINAITINTLTSTAVNATTVDATNVEVTNIKAKDGTAAATIADSTGIVSLSANPILSGGTANGVLYLNGSKVATSGSALVFDGTNLGVGPATPTAPLSVGSANEFLVYNAMTAFPSSGSDSSVFIARTGSTGSAPFNNAGSLIYRPRVSSDAGRSSHIFYTGSPSAERLRINESGNVGIGTTAPAKLLDLSANNNALAENNTLRFTDTDPSTEANQQIGKLEFYSSDGSSPGASVKAYIGAFAEDTTPDAYLAFATAASSTATERLRIDSAGNVGIGTSSPGYKLHVTSTTGTIASLDGSGTTTGAAGTGASLLFGGNDGTFNRDWALISGLKENSTNQNTASYLSFSTRANGGSVTERMRLDSSGNLGIGTSSPAVPLDVVSNSGSNGINIRARSSNDYGFLNFKSNDGSDTAGSIAALRAGVNSGSLLFYTGTTEKARLDTSGNLGIGTSSPAVKLDVAGASTTQVRVQMSGQADVRLLSDTGTGITGTYSNHPFTIKTNSADVMSLTAAGSVGIGTSSPGARLHVSTASADTIVRVGNNSTYDQYIYFQGNNDWSVGMDYSNSNAFTISNNSVLGTNDRLVLTTSGNLGLGVTPGTWTLSGASAMQIKNAGWMGYANNSYFTANASNAAGAWKYIANGVSALYEQNNGAHAWSTAGSGTAGNTISFTQAMTLDASGNLGVGTTSPTSFGSGAIIATVAGTTGYGGYLGSTSNVTVQMWADEAASAGSMGTRTNHPIRLTTNNAERARITSGGYFKASPNGTYVGAAGSYHEFRQTGDDHVLYVSNSFATVTNNSLFIVTANRNTTNNTFYAMGYYNDAAAAFKLRVADSGDVTNTNGTYGTISDAKMKTDIVDAGSQWDDLKAVRFRKFKMKDDPSGLVQLGVVAQELEQVSPGLVDEHIDTEVIEVTDEEGNVTKKQRPTGTTTKSVKTSVLLMKAAVALQEAMARIEKLEAEMAALKGA